MHSLIVLWGNWVMHNGTTEITMTKRTQQICQMISIIKRGKSEAYAAEKSAIKKRNHAGTSETIHACPPKP
jgi:hypothetical protein